MCELTDSLSDAALLDQSRDDPERFGIIFDRHFSTIYRYIARRIGPDGADELAGESFRIAFERRESFDPAWSSARPWLYGIATNLLRGHYRSEQRRLRAMRRSMATAQVAVAESAFERAGERLDAETEMNLVATAIATLAASDRDTLVLFALEGLSYAEVAEVLAIPVGTVRSRINRARTQIRELLNSTGQVLPDQHNQHRPKETGHG